MAKLRRGVREVNGTRETVLQSLDDSHVWRSI